MVRIFNIYFSAQTILAAISDIAVSSTIVFCIFYLPALSHQSSNPAILFYPGLLLIFWLWVLYTFDLYDTGTLRSPRAVLQRTTLALGVVSFASVLVLNLFRDQKFSSVQLELSLVLFAIVSIGMRWSMDWGYKYFGFGDRLLILGSEAQAETVKQAIRDNPNLQVQAMACCGIGALSHAPIGAMYPRASCAVHIERMVDIYRPHRIVVSQETPLDESIEQLLLYSRSRGVAINTVEDFFALAYAKAPLGSLKTNALMYGDAFHKKSIKHAIHRVVNLFLAAALLVVSLPVGALVALAIALETRGPIFYSQERVGFRGKNFRVIKFRSMRLDAESNCGPTWAAKNDPRITKVGGVLRKLRLDEIPQLWNVVMGEMNLVGPRPERPHFVEILREHIPFYDLRHSVRPGITGWAQVMAAYGDSIESSRLKVEYDIFYLRRASLSFDFYILFRTIKIALSGRGAQ